jgi:hypothetical protein
MLRLIRMRSRPSSNRSRAAVGTTLSENGFNYVIGDHDPPHVRQGSLSIARAFKVALWSSSHRVSPPDGDLDAEKKKARKPLGSGHSYPS